MNCTLSPGLSLVSWSLSRTVKTMVMPGMSRLLDVPMLEGDLAVVRINLLDLAVGHRVRAGAATWLGLGLVWA